MKKPNEKILRCAEFINSHADEIVQYVDKVLLDFMPELKDKVLDKIKEYLDPRPKRFDWVDNGDPYDYSGEIRENGYISLNQTLESFLEEYTGAKEATYVSSYGWRYTTYGDEIADFIFPIVCALMKDSVFEFLENKLNSTFSEDEKQDILFECKDFDLIYDGSLANNFFAYESSQEYLEIDNNLMLSDIMGKRTQD